MKPKSIPRGMEIGTSVKEEASLLILKNMQCQKGYVPIRRATKEDLLVEKYLSSLRISSPANVYSSNDTGLRLSNLQNIPMNTLNLLFLNYCLKKRKDENNLLE